MTYLGNSPARIDLGALTLNYADPESGLAVGFDMIAGWHGGAPMSVNQQQRTGHGQFAIPGRRMGRTVTINGWAVVEQRAVLASWLDTLAATLGDGGFDDLTVTDDDQSSRSATVQLLATEVDWSGRDWVRFQLSLLAPDPYRYGSTQMLSTTFATDPEGRGLRYPAFSPSGVMYYGPPPESDGTVTVTNHGNAPARPIFYVDGPGPVGGFSILDLGTGRRVTYLGALPTGSSLVLDSSDGSVVIDGTADRRGDTIVTGWPEVAPGASVTFRFAPEASTSAAVMTVLLRSTYY